MIFLLNRERILKEVLELATLKISEVLGVEPEKINVRVHVEDGVLKPQFKVGDDYDKMSPPEVGAVITGVWDSVRPELINRLKGMNTTRDAT